MNIELDHQKTDLNSPKLSNQTEWGQFEDWNGMNPRNATERLTSAALTTSFISEGEGGVRIVMPHDYCDENTRKKKGTKRKYSSYSRDGGVSMKVNSAALTASWNSLPDDMIEVITFFLDNGSLHEFAVVSKKSTKIVRKAGKLVCVFVIRPPANKRILALNHGDRRDGPLLFGGRRSPKFDSYSRLDVYDIQALNCLIE